MNFLRLFKKYRELENLNRIMNAELCITKEALAEARAKLQRPSPAANVAAPPPRPHKVPHCHDCKHHERFNEAGKHMHRCVKVGRMISGNDTRTSPKWCPLRGKEQA